MHPPANLARQDRHFSPPRFVGSWQDDIVNRKNSPSPPATTKPGAQPTSAEYPPASKEKPAMALDSPPRHRAKRVATERDLELTLEQVIRANAESFLGMQREGPVSRDTLVSSNASSPSPPSSSTQPATGVEALPPGALAKRASAAEEKNLSNRGMKLNESRKSKREQLAKQAAEEVEESTMKMIQAARAILDAQGQAKKELTPSEGISDRNLNLRRSNAPEPPSQLQWEGEVDDDDDKDHEEEGDEEEEGYDYESYDGERHPGSWAPPPYHEAFRRDLPSKQQDDDLEVQPGADNGNSPHAASPEEKLLDDPGNLGPVHQPSIDEARHSPYTTGMKQGEGTSSQIEPGSSASKVERTLDTPTAAASLKIIANLSRAMSLRSQQKPKTPT